MTAFPTGKVTFLFTDIEGSTRLLQELSDAYPEALAEHRRLLRDAFAHHHGVEVDTQGDAFFVAFARAADALAAAREAQVALGEGPMRVRMGIHTGEALATDEGYVGIDVHRAARIAAVGHGGQVLVSQSTRDLTGLDDLLLLGEHRLKDFDDSIALFQLGEGDFPPLKTISNTNLPSPVSSFVGRGRELADVLAQLRNGARLLTLTGPGGSGKTRLAIEAAGELVPEFKAGVFWVDLAPVQDSALVAETIARTIGARAVLAEHIGDRELLLLLDNLEQVVDAAPDLASLVEACPKLKLLVTSRELLRVRGEVEYGVEPLNHHEAVELFCDRAGAEADRAVKDLCRALDNLPLALELAAARTSVLSPRQISERLADRLDLFTGGRDAEPRQRTLRATIAWSHDLLGGEEQQLFAQLAIFVRGCTSEAAESVAGARLDALQSLVEKGLVRHTDERFWMLETIREFAAERLRGSGEAAKTARRHAEHYRSFALDAAAELAGPRPGDAIERVERDLDNVRSAIRWSVEEGRFEVALSIVVSLERYWSARGCPKDILDLVDEAVERAADFVDDELRAQALWVGGFDAARASEPDRAERLYRQSLELFRRLGRGYETVRSLSELAIIKEEQGCEKEATELAKEALATAQELGEPRAADAVATCLGTIAYWRGDFAQAAEHYQESLRLRRQGDSLPGPIASRLLNIGLCARALEDYDRAETALREAHAVATGSGHAVFIGSSAAALGYVMLARSDLAGARSFLREALDVVPGIENVVWTASALNLAAALAAAGGESRTAARLWGVVDTLLEETEHRPEAADQLARQRSEQAARLTLGPSQFATAAEDGRRMPVEEALQLAMGVV